MRDEMLYTNTSMLAFVGDAAYELCVRLRVSASGAFHSERLHRDATRYVRASAQASAIKAMLDGLPEEERRLVKRARNKRITTKPKNADPVDYKWATAFEALLGYYCLTEQSEKLEAAASAAMRIIDIDEAINREGGAAVISESADKSRNTGLGGGVTAIAAADARWGIGFEGGLLADLPGDRAYFRECTLNKTVVMGRKTLKSLPGGKPLPSRTNIVLSRNALFRADCEVFSSFDDCASRLESVDSSLVYIAGGAEIYALFLPYCDECLITKIDAVLPADSFFPNLDADGAFERVWESEPQSENGFTYRFTRYVRKDARAAGMGIGYE
ncbi:MAG: dihydrofolate reductase [Clostridiales Family XIII bacterium]|jgi:dihydrofolate reductase|nr:dihydrofolate reductase [Clostridiales Family XIII bacterium]